MTYHSHGFGENFTRANLSVNGEPINWEPRSQEDKSPNFLLLRAPFESLVLT